MVYMSRMPVGGKEGQSRLGKRTEDGPKQSEGADGSADTSQGLEAERESNKRSLYKVNTLRLSLVLLIKNDGVMWVDLTQFTTPDRVTRRFRLSYFCAIMFLGLSCSGV